MTIRGVKISVAGNPHLGYEVPGSVRRFFEKLYLPILNNSSQTVSRLIRRSSRSARQIHTHAASHRALEILYLPSQVLGESAVGRLLNFVWLQLRNSKAVRNRLRLVRHELGWKLAELAEREKSVCIFSIGAGSGRAVIGALVDFKPKHPRLKLTAILLDKNEEALEHSRALAVKNGVAENLVWVQDTASAFEKSCAGFQPHIFEVVGLADYFDDARAARLFRRINRCLAPGGYLIWGNIRDNIERRFITTTVEWPMIYRTPEDLVRLSLAAGFKPANCHIVYEPLKIHGIAICRK